MSIGAHFVRVPGSRFEVSGFRFGIWNLEFGISAGLPAVGGQAVRWSRHAGFSTPP